MKQIDDSRLSPNAQETSFKLFTLLVESTAENINSEIMPS